MSRRELLGGLGAVSLAALMPRSRGYAQAQNAAPPTRFLVVHVPEGMWSKAPRPAAGASDFGQIFGALNPYRSQTSIINGLKIASRDQGPGGDGHHRGVPHMLTGIEMADASNAGGPSIDQKIAAKIGQGMKFGSLQFAVRIVYNDTNARPIWSGPKKVVPAVQDPWEAYKRIFAGVQASAAMPGTAVPVATKFDLRKSALDYAVAEVASLRPRLAASDRERLDSYQDSLRDIERRLSTTGPTTITGSSCTPPSLGGTVDKAAEANYPKVGQLQMDLITAAFQCQLTRVASLQWGNSNDQCSYSFLGVNALGHDLSHNNGNVDSSGAKKLKVYQWYSQQFAYLLNKLQSIPEGAGSMLDNTVILWASEFSDSNGHAADNLCWLLMGNAAGYFKQGQVLDLKGRSVNDLHATLQNAFGIADQSFGGAAYCKGPIADIKA